MKGYIRGLAAALAVVAALGLAGQASADTDGEIKYRQSVMKAVGGHMGAMATILKGKGGSKENLAGHAHAMAELSKIAGGIFPEDSDFGETRALPVIWEKPVEFKQALTAFQTEAAKLVQVAKGGDMNAFGAQFKNLGGACGGCHKKFREKK